MAMEDAAHPRGGDVPPGAGDLPPKYQALVAGSYNEEALLQQVLEASKAEEDEAYPGYSDAIALTGMVAGVAAISTTTTAACAAANGVRGAGGATSARCSVPPASP
jgi:hypothetical protein